MLFLLVAVKTSFKTSSKRTSAARLLSTTTETLECIIAGTLTPRHTLSNPEYSGWYRSAMNTSTMSSLGNDELWIVVEDDEPELEGMTLVADRESGEIVSLSTRSCRDEQKRNTMPSLERYPHLKVVDLHNYRNMRDLHESVCNLPNLQKLALTRCDFLTRLPASIGNLHSLVEVSIAVALTIKRQRRLDVNPFSNLFVFHSFST